MKIGFDLDRVFIDYPPLIPPQIIDWFYRDHGGKKLSYSIPRSPLSQFLRKLTHSSFLRPQITQNIACLKQFSRNRHALYLISSRYQFLENLTYKILDKYKLSKYFSKIFLNIQNQQPHLFKAKTIKQLGVNLYVDDDLELLQYLKTSCPTTKLLWYNPADRKVAPANGIVIIRSLSELNKYLK